MASVEVLLAKMASAASTASVAARDVGLDRAVLEHRLDRRSRSPSVRHVGGRLDAREQGRALLRRGSGPSDLASRSFSL
jgi:hypothetical protein